jgi:hypothetical protein
MDLNKQKDTIGYINTASRISKLISGIILSLVLIAMGIFFIVIAPTTVIVYLLPIGGVAFLTLTIIIFIRQSKKPSASEDAAAGKLTYANFTQDSMRYAAPKGAATTPAAHGTVKAWLAPAMPSGVVSVTLLGQGTYTRQENTVLLTDDALVCLQIPPTQEATSDSVVGTILSVLPTDATTKNMFTSSFDRSSLRETVESEVATNSIETLMQKYYSFSIPFSEVASIEFHRIGGIHLKTQSLGTFQWMSGFGEDEKFLEAMKIAGLPVNLG